MSEISHNTSGEDMPEKDDIKCSSDETGDVNPDIVPDEYTENTEKPKKEKKVSLFTFILTTVSLVLAAVMTTYTVSSLIYQKKLSEVQLSQSELYDDTGFAFELFSRFIDKYSFENADEDAMMAAALKAYVAATGDRYAYYYTAEEFDEYRSSNAGQTEGIGINIVQSEAQIGGSRHLVLRVINIVKDSPASKSDLKIGDVIYGVGIGETMQTVTELGYDRALSSLVGAAGTEAVFTVYRESEGRSVEFSIIRENVKSESVRSRVHSTEPSVGIIQILQFDLTTPSQFKEQMDGLITSGCTKFVFDVRNNPGGDLRSIQAVLSYFLNEGDVTIRTVYKDGTEKVDKVGVADYAGEYSECNVTAEDIGRYKNDKFSFVVLCNGNTASAGELFTATFRDYGLGRIVGTKTFGKGSMQSIISLAPYGYSGALKLTVAKYFSGANGGNNDGYDGVGIYPDDVVELSEEAASKSIYELTDAEDDQLIKALECLNN